MKICIVQPNPPDVSETFLRAHAEKLPGNVTILHGKRARTRSGQVSLSEHLKRAPLAIERVLLAKDKKWEYTQSYLRAFRQLNPDVVIAEYGPTGVHVMDACRDADVPMIVHFRGYDASHIPTLATYRKSYARLFQQAGAIVAVSHSIARKLHELGADPLKIYHNPSGADCHKFVPADPAAAPPVFLAVGRFTDKKAPHLTILAFAEVHRQRPKARLRMIGTGSLFPFCQELVRNLRLEGSVELLGRQPHSVVQTEMRQARTFVQHSVIASHGDSEGTPGSVMEAGASGLPVVATRHAGIPDVVIHEETGLLCNEHDVYGMSRLMLRLVDDANFAAKLGQAARRRVVAEFSQERSIEKLWSIIQTCASERTASGVDPVCNGDNAAAA